MHLRLKLTAVWEDQCLTAVWELIAAEQLTYRRHVADKLFELRLYQGVARHQHRQELAPVEGALWGVNCPEEAAVESASCDNAILRC